MHVLERKANEKISTKKYIKKSIGNMSMNLFFKVKGALLLVYMETLITFVSISRSSRSLMVHPAPRRSKAPQPNRAIIFTSGILPGAAAKEIDLKIKAEKIIKYITETPIFIL